MTPFLFGLFAWLGAFFRSRCNLSLEIIALRQQLGVLKRKTPRPRLRMVDRVFWILLHRLWPGWCNALIIVKPETVVGWHRAGFRLFWRIRSRSKNIGRPKIDAEIRAIIRRMTKENPTWGAPRIHGELLKLGFHVSERTVSRYLRRLSPSDQKRKLWLRFCAIIEKSLRPWIFSTYRLSPSEFCIAFLSSSMVGAKFFILMPRNTRQAPG